MFSKNNNREKPSFTERAGLTLTEVLVTTTIIGGLMALAIPAVMQARQAARRMDSQNNLRQIGVAVTQFENDHRYYPINHQAFESQTLGGGVRESNWKDLLPYLEQRNAHDSYDRNNWYFAGSNLDLATQNISVLQSPASVGVGSFSGQVDFSFIAGDATPKPLNVISDFNQRQEWIVNGGWPKNLNGVGAVDERPNALSEGSPSPVVNSASITDGLSNTMMVGVNLSTPASIEGNNPALLTTWANPGYALITTALTGEREVSASLSNQTILHGMALNEPVLYADGHVSWVGKEIDREVLKNLSTRNGGEITSPR